MALPDFFNADRFNKLRSAMGDAQRVELNADLCWVGMHSTDLLRLFSTGIEVPISDVKTAADNSFEWKGRKVFVYIKDQMLHSPNAESNYVFHLTDCLTLATMRRSGRASRYVVCAGKGNVFRVNLLYGGRVVQENIERPLRVCKHCLNALDYKGYASASPAGKEKISAQFNVEQFLQDGHCIGTLQDLPQPQLAQEHKVTTPVLERHRSLAPNSGGSTPAKCYALLVGVSRYQASGADNDAHIPPLRYAEKDAETLAALLQSSYGFEVRSLVGEQASKQTIRSVLESNSLYPEQATYPGMGENGLFLFFFAGHGEQVPGGYVLHPYDAAAHCARNSLYLTDLGDYLTSYLAAHHCLCILDACRSGLAGIGRDAAGLRSVSCRDISALAKRAMGHKKIELLFGCREGQCCYEDENAEHGVFTTFLMDVLSNAASYGGLSFLDLADQVNDKMQRWQHPEYGFVQTAEHHRVPGSERIMLRSTNAAAK